VNYYSADSLHHLAHERRARLLGEAHTERLAREIRATLPRRRRPPLSIGLTLPGRRRAIQQRVEA
jgi:hypothetical protein